MAIALFLALLPSVTSAALNDAIAYWAFDESSGSATDSSGNGRDLTNNNTTPYVAAKINNGADLEFGSSQFFSRSNGAYFDVTAGTINCWLKPETIDVTPGNIELWNTETNIGAGGVAFTLRPHNSDTIAGYFGGGSNAVGGSTSLNPGSWYMVTFGWDTSGKEIFLNATSDGTNTTDETLTAGASNAYVGSYLGTALYYDGIMDECGFWNRLLSGTEITSLYNSGSGTNPYAASPAAPKVPDIIHISRGDWVWQGFTRGPIPPHFSPTTSWTS